jgi:hypothetical protein
MIEIITFLAIIVGGVSALVAFDALAVRFGTDSRDRIGDSHRR